MASLVYIVDDDASFRTAVSRLLRAAGYEIVACESGQQLLERLRTDTGPSCILLDVDMPGLRGPELQGHLKQLGSALPIVFLTGHGDIPESVRAIKAGAEDFLTKPAPKERLLDAIERAITRHRATREQQQQINTLEELVATLTPREREVFPLVVQGKLNKQIAHQLGISERTIKAHRRNVMEKIRARSLLELVSIAERLGILAGRKTDP